MLLGSGTEFQLPRSATINRSSATCNMMGGGGVGWCCVLWCQPGQAPLRVWGGCYCRRCRQCCCSSCCCRFRRGLLRILWWRVPGGGQPLSASARARERREQLQQSTQLQQWRHAQQMLRVRAQIRVSELRELWSWNNRNHPTKLASSFRAHSFVPAARSVVSGARLPHLCSAS
jgi:hypothetical protein